jgi:hypothetical protein
VVTPIQEVIVIVAEGTPEEDEDGCEVVVVLIMDECVVT